MRSQKGQSLIEFSLCLAVVTPLLLLSGKFVFDLWERTRCAYQTFEATHARLVGLKQHPSTIRLSETPSAVSGEKSCGHTREQVTLLKLEDWIEP